MSSNNIFPILMPTKPGKYKLNGKDAIVMGMSGNLFVRIDGKTVNVKDVRGIWSRINERKHG